MSSATEQMNELLRRAVGGDPAAAEELLPLLYEKLRALASRWIACLPPGQTLQPTELVHEAYLRIRNRNPLEEDARRQFFLFSARVMRDILVEQARRKSRLKRGGGQRRVKLVDLPAVVDTPLDDLLALDAAMARIQKVDPEGHQVVLLRYFAGFTAPEIADALGVSPRTVDRKWRYLRAWLSRELSGAADA